MVKPMEYQKPIVRRGRNRARRGLALIYSVLAMFVLVGICSLAVDYGRVQLIKSEMQRCADATARGYMTYYNLNGKAYADSHVAQLYASSHNPVDSGSGISPTVTVLYGSWNLAANKFVNGAGGIPAVKVTVTRTAANSNSVPVTWGGLLGTTSIDVHATAVAALMPGQSAPLSIPATADLYFAGMPAYTTDSWGDNFANNSPYQMSAVTVTPGTYITFTNLSGTSSVVPGSVAFTGPAGNWGDIVNHGENWDYSFNNPGPQNGIADARMPEDAMVGLFLTNTEPDLNTAPAGQVDWTTFPMANQATYSNIVVQQPFMIGSGQTSGGVTQQFLVPPGATRLFLGVWDGVDYANNSGSLAGTVTTQSYVELMQ
jgi:Putative Tad-like Flp pilus-assembly